MCLINKKNIMSKYVNKSYFELHFGFDEPKDLPERVPSHIKKAKIENKIEDSSGKEVPIDLSFL